jgi:hypothetical protein
MLLGRGLVSNRTSSRRERKAMVAAERGFLLVVGRTYQGSGPEGCGRRIEVNRGKERRGLRSEVGRLAFDIHLFPQSILIMSASSTAQKTFELMNDVRALDPADEIFLYDVEEQKKLVRSAPWKQEFVSPFSFPRELGSDHIIRWCTDGFPVLLAAPTTSRR